MFPVPDHDALASSMHSHLFVSNFVSVAVIVGTELVGEPSEYVREVC